MFAQAHSGLPADYTSITRPEAYTFPSLVTLQMEMMLSQAMTVLCMMDLPVLVSLGLWEMSWEYFGTPPPNPNLCSLDPTSLDEAYSIHLPAVRRLLLYNIRNTHPKVTYTNFVRSTPSLTHPVLSPGLTGMMASLKWLHLRPQGDIKAEAGHNLCLHLEDLSIFDAEIEEEDLKNCLCLESQH